MVAQQQSTKKQKTKKSSQKLFRKTLLVSKEISSPQQSSVTLTLLLS